MEVCSINMKSINFKQFKRYQKMRYLTLDSENYTIFYSNILNAGQGFNKQEIRVIDKLLTKVESIGLLQEDTSYKWNEKDLVLTLEDAEWHLMDRINNGIKFNPRHAHMAAKYLDWFDNAATKPPVELHEDKDG